MLCLWRIGRGIGGPIVLAVVTIGLAAPGAAAQRDASTPVTSLATTLAGGLRPGTVVHLDGRQGPWVEQVAVANLRGEPGRPVVIRGLGEGRAVIRGRFRLTAAAHVVLERLAFEPDRSDGSEGPWLSLEGDHIELRDCSIRAVPGDGLRLAGAANTLRGGEVAACEGLGVVLEGSARVDGVRVVACRKGGLRAGGEATVSNSLFLHNRGPALEAEEGTALRFYHNLVYDNGGGLMLAACRSARVLNNVLVNNYAAVPASDRDVEIHVGGAAAHVDHNVYFRHPAKDKLLRGLPYAQGVDLAPLAPDGPFGLRLRLGNAVVNSPQQQPWAGRLDGHSQSLDIVQRFTGENRYTRSYEDLFVDFQQEDFRPRFSSPAVGRGADLTAEVPADAAGRPRSARHPDCGPYAAPAAWWEEIDSGRATIVDGTVSLDAQGRDCGLGTLERPFATLAKAAAFARWGSRIYLKDSIYRHTAMQTTFSLGPDSAVSGFPGHRPAFSPSEFIDPARWEQVTPSGLYRLRDWHTFLGYTWRMNAWMEDYYGNARVGGPGENVTSLSRNRAHLARPFRPIRCLPLDRDTPQVLVDGVALQQAGGVLGLEELGIGTMSAWGRDPSHLRPGSFMVGRRDVLVSKAVGRGRLAGGQGFLEGPNREPEMNYRIGGRNVGFVSEFVARPERTWHAVHAYAGKDRLWKLDPAVTAKLGAAGRRRLDGGWRRVEAGKDSACWVRQFALPAFELARPDGTALARHEGPLERNKLPVYGWLQRQVQTGDPALQAVFDNPNQDYLEVRLPAGVDPNRLGLSVGCFSGRVEAVWRKGVPGEYSPGVNAPGLAMLSHFRTMEACSSAEATAATLREPWQFGFLVPLGETRPALFMRMPAEVDPNAEDPWRLTVVDDCLYVWLLQGESPAGHSVEVASNATNYAAAPVGSNPSFADWQDVGPLRPDWPAARVYRTELDFGANALEPLWIHGGPAVSTQGFELDTADPTGRTLHLLDDVRLDAGDPPGAPREKVLLVRYHEGEAASPVRREFRVSSRQIGIERRIVLPSKPVAFDSRYVLFVAPADRPEAMVEQVVAATLRQVPSRQDLAQGTFCYDASGHVLYVCLPPATEPWAFGWQGGRSDPIHLVRGLYTVGGNAYGHQKQYCWGSGLGIAAGVFDDVSVGFSPGGNMPTVPGSVVRDCTFRWCGAEVGRGGVLSGDERHTADRIRRPELHVDHCVFDAGNAFLFDGNDNPTKNIPFGNHHVWENSYFLPAMGGMMGPWWDQYCFNNVVQNCIFAGRGGVDVEVSENLIVRNNLFTTDKGSFVTFRGSDRGCVLNNTTFRGGGIWFHSEPERANATEQGAPTYGPSFPLLRRGPVPWLSIDPIRHEKGISLDVRWIALKDQAEVYYCENWDQPSPMLIDAKGFASYRAVGEPAQMARGTYFHDAASRRLYVRLADGSPPRSASVAPPHIPQTEQVRRDLVYTLTVVRPGRLSIPFRALSKTELEIIEPLRPGQAVEVLYHDARGRQAEKFPISAAMLALGRPRVRLSGQPAGDRLFVGLEGQRPPLVRVTGSWTDVTPFDAELIPGASILASSLMGIEFHVLRGHFADLKQGDQLESVFHSRSVYHLASLNNLFLDGRSHVASDAMDNMHHGANYLLFSEHTDPSHSRIDYNGYWKDLHAVPGPLSAFIFWGRELVWNSTAAKEGITLAEFCAKTGYEAHGLAPPSYFTLVANPLRFDFRPLPDSPLLGAGTAVRHQAGTFLFDPDEGNGQQRFTFKGNERDMAGQPRGERPSIGALENPVPGARACYLAPDGVDGPGRGSRKAPWATAAYALDRMRPGDLLVLRPGTYRQPVVIRRSGTPRDFLHVVAEGPPYDAPKKFPTPGPTVLDAAGMGSGPAVLLDGCAHVRVAGLRVVNSQAPAAVELRNTRDCVVEYLFVRSGTGAAIRATGRGNTLYECDVAGGSAGYELAGSLTDVRWCASSGSPVGFRTIGPVAGVHLLQNRHLGGGRVGFELTEPASDVVLDGNWAEGTQWGYAVAGSRILLVNNNADAARGGILVRAGADVRIWNNNVLRAAEDALVLGGQVRSALVLNNVLQADRCQVVLETSDRPGAIWLDYNLYARASLPFDLAARHAGRTFAGLAAWSGATGMDRNSRVAPLVYSKLQDGNGRWRVRECCISVSNLTPHFNVGPLGANASPYAGGGTYVLDLPQNWKPHGDPARRVYLFDTAPGEGALAARAYWYLARVDYRRRDGTRAQQDLYRADVLPDELPAGAICQDAATGRVYVRLPADAEEPCPIGKHLTLSPQQAIGYYAGREVTGAAEKYRGKLVTESLAAAMRGEGIRELDAVANYFSCLCGSPTLEKGCPIVGLHRDADSDARPSVPLGMSAFGSHSGPGRFDVGAWEHGYFVP